MISSTTMTEPKTNHSQLFLKTASLEQNDSLFKTKFAELKNLFSQYKNVSNDASTVDSILMFRVLGFNVGEQEKLFLAVNFKGRDLGLSDLKTFLIMLVENMRETSQEQGIFKEITSLFNFLKTVCGLEEGVRVSVLMDIFDQFELVSSFKEMLKTNNFENLEFLNFSEFKNLFKNKISEKTLTVISTLSVTNYFSEVNFLHLKMKE